MWVFGFHKHLAINCLWLNVVIFPTDLTLTLSEFHRVGAATEKALVR